MVATSPGRIVVAQKMMIEARMTVTTMKPRRLRMKRSIRRPPPRRPARASPPAGGDARAGRRGGGRLMLRFILRRLGFMVVTVILASIIIFWATTILPGDVATMVLGRYATQQAKDTLRTELGLDKPIAVQYTTCLLYTSDAADDLLCVDLGGRRIIK